MESEGMNETFHFQVALGAFQKRLELTLPLLHYSEFYEEARLKEVLRLERSKIGKMFIPKLNGEEDGSTDLSLELLSTLEKFSDEYILKNQENRKKSEGFLEKFMDVLCEMLKASMESLLSLEPDMPLDLLEDLFQLKISEIVMGFESSWIWKPGNSEFRLEQKKKLKERLDRIVVDSPNGGLSAFQLQLKQEVKDLDDVTRDSRQNVTGLRPNGARLSKSRDVGTRQLRVSERLSVKNSSKTASQVKPSLPCKQSEFSHRNRDNEETRGSLERLNPDEGVDPLEAQDLGQEPESIEKSNDGQGDNEVKVKPPKKRKGNKVGIPAHISIFNIKGKPSMYKCNFCQKVFKWKQYIPSHKSCPDGEVAFKCDHCGKGFTRKDSLTEHIRLHTGEKPYACAKCNQSFSRRDRLQQHISRMHSRKLPHPCNQCGRAFVAKWNLLQHVRTHSDARLLKCSICELEVNRSYSLSRHMKRAHQKSNDEARSLAKLAVEESRKKIAKNSVVGVKIKTENESR